MHPLAVFPSLLTYSFFVPTILRIIAAVIFIWLVWHHARNRTDIHAWLERFVGMTGHVLLSLFIVIELAVALCLFFGLYTQSAALMGGIIALIMCAVRTPALSPLGRTASLLLLAILFSLLITGGGAFALDIPL